MSEAATPEQTERGPSIDRGFLAHIARSVTIAQHRDALRASSPEAMRPLCERVDLAKLGAYRGYTEVIDALASLHASGRARVSAFGESVLGVPLFACEFLSTREPRSTSSPASAVAFGGIHAMEWIGVEIALSVCARLAEAPPPRRVVVVPLVNVDGYRRAEAALAAGRRGYVRANANGVDLNRNWPTHFRRSWTRRMVQRALPFLGGSGRAPRSEPEIAALIDLCDELARGGPLERALSFHSFGNKVLYPYGGRWRPPARSAELRAAASSLRDRLRGDYEVLQVARWAPGFFAPGMEIDHLHDAYGALALLVECGGGGVRLREPRSVLHPWRWYNPREPAVVVDDVAPAAAAFLRGE